jgi:S-adenosylmethionine synthetase
MNLTVATLTDPSVAALPLEIVERKGAGHPDNICDALAEEFSAALSRYYAERFGVVMHHSVDQVLLRAGEARAVFGGGVLQEPIGIYFGGRATRHVDGETVPVEELAAEAAQRWLRANLRALDVDRHVRMHCLVRSSPPALAALFRRQIEGGDVLANDTAVGIGFAPLDELENVVLDVEHQLNSAAVHVACPALGEDIKVTGVRELDRVRLVIQCAFIAAHVKDLEHYRREKAQVARLALGAVRTDTGAPVQVLVNPDDERAPAGACLTVTGTFADSRTGGMSGRGNRVNGLVTPCRPMSLEAAAGGNSLNSVGKLYNVAAWRIAREIKLAVAGIVEVRCCLVSEAGQPLAEPRVIDVQLRLEPDASLAGVRPQVREIVAAHLATLNNMWREAAAPA